MADKNKTQDDSAPEDAFASDMPMSEILAAIRKSIADPVNAPQTPPAINPAVNKMPEPEEDVLELTDEDVLELNDEDVLELTDEAEPEDIYEQEDSDDTVGALTAEAEAINQDFVALEMDDPEADIEALMDAVDAEEATIEDDPGLPPEDAPMTDATFEALAQGLLANAELDRDPNYSPVEAFVADMMRPLLREWLDEHMPDLVEKALRQELANRSED